jgi:ABC-type bacteriocin/lantibiotic exporter with double-glycine peptidase domain
MAIAPIATLAMMLVQPEVIRVSWAIESLLWALSQCKTIEPQRRSRAKSLIAATNPRSRTIRYASPLRQNRTTMSPIISVSGLSKTYASGLSALKNVNLEIRRGEIFALLGPNGAGKTTLISIICGIVNPTQGTVKVDGHDIVTAYRAARSMIGLVPQELTTDAFETPWGAVSFSRGLFGKAPNPAHIE